MEYAEMNKQAQLQPQNTQLRSGGTLAVAQPTQSIVQYEGYGQEQPDFNYQRENNEINHYGNFQETEGREEPIEYVQNNASMTLHTSNPQLNSRSMGNQHIIIRPASQRQPMYTVPQACNYSEMSSLRPMNQYAVGQYEDRNESKPEGRHSGQ